MRTNALRRKEELRLLAIAQLERLVKGDLSLIHPALIEYLMEEGAIREDRFFPVKAAVSLVKLGVAVERAAKLLNWSGFESLCEEIFRSHGFHTIKHLRFLHEGRRYEIDLLALSNDVMLSVDCKQLSRIRSSLLIEAASKQKERTKILAEVLPNLRRFDLALGRTWIIPMVVCWIAGGPWIHSGVPIVPLHSLNLYLVEFDPMDREIARIEAGWKVKYVKGISNA